MLSRFLLLFLFGFGFGIRGGVCKTPKNMVKRELHHLPIGENQKLYCDYLANKEIPVVVGLGPAGCGKTMFACNAAVVALVSGDVDKIIITRPTVSVDEELGFLPGTLEHKMDPWVRPIFDVLGDFYSKTEVKRLMDDGIIEIAPLAYMRGRTFRRSFLIADEMQNSSPNQMLMMLTRIGEDSKMVITGDLQQSDRPGKNGLDDFCSRLSLRNVNEDCDGIRFIKFGIEDVKRSAVVATILKLYEPVSKNDGSNHDSALIPKGLDKWDMTL